MVSSGLLRRVALVRTDVSKEPGVSNGQQLCITEYQIVFFCSLLRLLVTTNVVPSLPILVTLTLEVLRSSETSVLTRAIRRNVPEDGILLSHRREDFKSYMTM
jgi:hypothetical protein